MSDERAITVIDPADIRKAWASLMQGKVLPCHRLGHVDHYATDPDNVHSFSGMSGRQLADALANGYYPQADEVTRTTAIGMGETQVPQVYVNEDEGELLIAEVLAGEEEYLARYEDQPEFRGVKILIDYCMNGGVSPQNIGAYFEWCLKVIEEFEQKGNAPAVELFINSRGLFRSEGAPMYHGTHITLVHEGEAVDPVTWRAFFTPGAFRTLGFMAEGMAAHKLGYRTSGGLGSAEGSDFGVIFDEDESTLTITCPSSFKEFPRKKMSDLLNTILERF